MLQIEVSRQGSGSCGEFSRIKLREKETDNGILHNGIEKEQVKLGSALP